MSYQYEQNANGGNDLVIKGWENGIANSPYSVNTSVYSSGNPAFGGVGDMRNIDIVSIPGEASVALSTTNSVTQASLQTQTFTASSSGGLLLTWAGGTPLANNTAITVANTGGALPTGLTANVAYYVINTSATTFNLSLNATGSAITYSNAGSGTNTFSTIDMNKPKFFTNFGYTDGVTGLYTYIYFCVDALGRVWYYYNSTQWVYLNNPYHNETRAGVNSAGNGLAAYKGYLLSFETQRIDTIQIVNNNTLITLSAMTTYTNWTQSWQDITTPWITTNFPIDIPHNTILSYLDDTVYFCNTSFVGSIRQVAGQVFNPATPGTYFYTPSALTLPSSDIAQCLAILGVNLLTGGINNVIYPWDRVSTNFVSPILLSENNIQRMITVNTTTYIFVGQRGRIYLTNGSNANFYKKVPDHLSGNPNPYFTWGDATFSRNQLYFGVQASNNDGTANNNYGGLWSIDLGSNAIRLTNKMSYGTYSGNVTALISLGGTPTSDGYGLLMGWFTTTGGIDKGSSSPYTGSQAYIDSDLIPVGQYLSKTTFSNIEWKLATPLVTGESVTLSYRTNVTAGYTQIGTTNTAGLLSDFYTINFDQVQWVQIRAQLTSTATTPSFVRLMEIRLR
jgi:hypothetical protein